MLKKIISAALSTCILCAGLALPASAKKFPVKLPGWESSFYNTPTDPGENAGWTEGKTGIEITTDPEWVKDGNGTLHLYCEKSLGNLYAYADQAIPSLKDGAKYRLTGSVYTTRKGKNYRMKFGDTWFLIFDYQENSELPYYPDYKVGEWFDINYDFIFDLAKYKSRTFRIQLAAGGHIYADNLSICEIITDEDGNETLGENLLVNGDFEMGLEASDEVTFTEQAEYVMNADEKSAQMRVLAASEFEGEATDYGFWIVDTRNMSAKDHEVSSAGEVLKSGDTFYTDINIELTNNEGEKVTPTQMTVYAIPWITFSGNNVVSGEAFTYNGDLTTKTVIKDKTKTFN